MASNWKDEEVFKLVEIWGNDIIKLQLEWCKRNREVYEKGAVRMKDAGFDRSAEQCREKAMKLKLEYRKIEDKHNKTGEGHKKWKFLEALDRVLVDKPATRPPLLVDTLGGGVQGGNESACEEEEMTDCQTMCRQMGLWTN